MAEKERAKAFTRLLIAFIKQQVKNVIGDEIADELGDLTSEALGSRFDDWLSDKARQISKAEEKAAARFLKECPDRELAQWMVSLPLDELPRIQSTIADLPNQLDDSQLISILHDEIQSRWSSIAPSQINHACDLYLDCLHRALATFPDFRQEVIVKTVLDLHDELRSLKKELRESRPPFFISPLPSSPLFTISSPPLDFTGRTAELKRLSNQLTLASTSHAHSAVAISVITGGAGIGKTALAYQVAKQLKNLFPDARLEINLRGAVRLPERPLTPSEAMRILLSPFYPGQSFSETDLHAIYVETLRKRKCLLLLDNAADAHQVRNLLPPTSSAAIITSRTRIDIPESGLHSLHLDLLTPAEARRLLRKVSSRLKRISSQNLDEISSACGHLPLALRVAARVFQDRPDWTVSVFLNRLKSEHTRLATLIHPSDLDLNVSAALELSYLNLPEVIKPLFRALGVFSAPFDEQALVAIWEGESKLSDVSSNALGVLLARNLLDYLEDSRIFILHDLTRLFARSLLCQPEHEDEALSSLERFTAYYFWLGSAVNYLYVQGGENVVLAISFFPLIWPHLSAAWARLSGSQPGWPTIEKADRWLCDFPKEMFYVLDLYLPPRLLVPYLEEALSAACRLEDQKLQGCHLSILGSIYADLSETQKAIEYHKQALEIARQIDDHRVESNLLGNLGNAYTKLGETQKAIEHYEQALETARQIGDRRMEGNALGNLGLAYVNLGDPQKAIEYLQEALEIARHIGDRRGEGADLGNLGLACVDLNEPLKAIAHYEQALEIARQIGDRSLEGNTLGNLGNAYADLGDPQKAKEYYQQALAIFEPILPSDHPLIIKTRNNLQRLDSRELLSKSKA